MTQGGQQLICGFFELYRRPPSWGLARVNPRSPTRIVIGQKGGVGEIAKVRNPIFIY